ncbi:MAG: hypothetical protein ACTHKZ_04480 [Lysobacteraceae bacterium]
MTDATPAPVHLLGALALELTPGSAADRLALGQDDAGALAGLIARDLATFEPEAAALELALVGAHYDVVEVLRPGWPLHEQLAQLAARAPRGGEGGRVIAFGAHADALREALAPSPEHVGGPLRVLPFVLRADDDALAARVGERLERDLVEHGMAGAATALEAQSLFGLRVEHARYLTVHDLAAMMAMQYEHAGLAPLWPLLEAALLAPTEEEWVDAPPEPLVHFAGGEARIALFSPAAWQARYAPDVRDGERLERGFAHFQARQRQFAALLGAHGVPVNFVHCGHDEPVDL